MNARNGEFRESDRDGGMWAGKSVARRFLSPDGFIVLVGRTASDNDVLTFKLAAPGDTWLHIASGPGSHVVIRNPQKAPIPRDTLRFAAALAAGYSSARKGGRTAVHVAKCSDVSKPRGFSPGKVALRRYRTVQVEPRRGDDSKGQ